jgi:hypothetical protein
VSRTGDAAERDVFIRALGAIDPTPVYAWRDPLPFVEPMDWSVSNAMYWQPPHEQDVVAADPGVIAALRPVADAVAAAPASAWWNAPVDLAALRYTSRFDAGHPPWPPTLTGARERLHRWRAGVLEEDHAAATDRPADPAALFSGCWWSTPAMASLVTTTRPLSGLGSIGLAWEEDSFGTASICAELTPTHPAELRCLVFGQVTGVGGRSLTLSPSEVFIGHLRC